MSLGSRYCRPTRRDLFVACVSAFCALLWFQTSQSHQFRGRRDEDNWPHHGSTRQNPLDTSRIAGGLAGGAMSMFMPSTTVFAHHAGWTLFENLYMHNGSLLVISDEDVSSFPERRLMTSTGRHPPNLCNLPSILLIYKHVLAGLPAADEPGNSEGTFSQLIMWRNT